MAGYDCFGFHFFHSAVVGDSSRNPGDSIKAHAAPLASLLIPHTNSESLILKLVSVAAVECHQLQVLQQRTRIGQELDMPASRTGQNRVSCAWSQARTHQLIALQLLLAA